MTMRIRIRQLLLITAAAFALRAQNATQQATAYALADDAFQLTPSARSVTRPLVVDRAALLTLTVTAPSRTLTVTLISPSGSRFTVGQPNSAAGFQSEIVPLASGSTTGASYVATLANPVPGNWSYSVSENNQPGAPLDVAAAATFNSTTRLTLIGGDDSFPPGVQVRMAAVVFDAAKKLTAVAITGVVRSRTDASFAPFPVTFRDDGTGGDERAADGVYEAFVTTTSSATFRPGTYVLHITATGTASTGAFVRTAAAQFRIVQRDAQITGFSDFGVDEDFDSYYDRIVVTARATVANAGTYRVMARLRGSNGREIQHSGDLPFSSGTANVDFSFGAAEIARDLGVSGPYRVAEIRYSHVSGGDVVPADVRYDLGATAAYGLDELQHPTIRLTGTGNAFGVDQNKNGLFDLLQVDLDIDADFSGTYDASVSLLDRNNHEIGFASGTVQLDSGVNTVHIAFDGLPIGENGLDGPYTLANLIAFGEDQSLIATTAFVTPAFHASSFEGYHVPRLRPARHR
jgi:hypothetical protein